MPTVDLGFGTTITFGTSGYGAVSTTAELLSVTGDNFTFEAVDTTHLNSTTARSFIRSDLYDPGTYSFEMHFDPSLTPPSGTASETYTITFPDSTTWACSGFMTGYNFGTSEDKMTLTMEVKLTGVITIT